MGFKTLLLYSFFIALFLCNLKFCSTSSLKEGRSAENTPEIKQQAFYIIFDNQIDNTTFPEQVCQNNGIGPQGNQCVGPMDTVYKGGVFITQPMNITKENIAKMKASVPGAIVLAYWCFQYIPIYSDGECSTGHIMGDRSGRNCSTTYACTDGVTPEFNQLINNAFPKKWAVNNLTTNSLVCGYAGQATYVPFKESADSLTKMLASVVAGAGFDGIYLDGYLNPATYEVKEKDFPAGSILDFNGDSIPDTVEQVQEQYKKYGPYFVDQLRQAIGPNKYLLSNSPGANPDPNLNGLTIEMEACLDLKECTDALMESKRVGFQPPLSVLWLTHSESMPGKQQCERAALIQSQMPWVQVGTDFFDGSHVVCNNTAISF